MRKALMTAVAVLALVVAVAVTQVGVFVVPAGATIVGIQPVSSLPESPAPGTVYIVTRGADMRFVDSADAICRREFFQSDEGCRGLVRNWVMRETRVLAELPYSETLWRLAAGGSVH